MECSPGKKTLIFLISWMSFMVVLEIGIGYYTSSRTLIVESFHMLSDLTAVWVATISYRMSARQWTRSTFGFARAETLGTFVNCVFFTAACFTNLIHCIREILMKTTIQNPILLVIVGAIGLIFNMFELILFHGLTKKKTLPHEGHSHYHVTQWLPGCKNDLEYGLENNSPALLHSYNGCTSFVFLIVSDAFGSVMVVIVGVSVLILNKKYVQFIDPIMAIVLMFIILYTMWPIFRESAFILLQTVPVHITITDLKERLVKEISGVKSVHELHVWQLAGNTVIATAHILCESLERYLEIGDKVKKFFLKEGIHLTTIQPEFSPKYAEMNGSENGKECLLDCPKSSHSCILYTCCGQFQQPELFTL